MGEVLKKFGRYFLLDQIAQGGMAEIFRARLTSPDGAGRLLVIKRIQPVYGSNAEFQRMFRSEIKVTMGFSHPNIVQLYDFGEEKGQQYIAMEFVDGKNLRQVISRLVETKQLIPLELAVYIAEQSAAGLQYAHNFKDKISGQPLNIIHRDISPQNILISYEGNVKVIDFGIAKATTITSEFTRAGVIKGKPSYLSPEQINGDPLDGRCDIFALGIVLWELLVGKKLFAGENDLAVLKLIESSQSHVKPPSSVNPKIPKELDAIVMKALSKNRDQRYQTADELQRVLRKFLYAYLPGFDPADLSFLIKELFKDDIVDDRKRIQRLYDKAEQLLVREPSAPDLVTQHGSDGEAGGTRTISDSELAKKSTGARETFLTEVKESPRVEFEGQADSLEGPRARWSGGIANPDVHKEYHQRYRPAPRQRYEGSGPAKSGGGFGVFLIIAAAAAALVAFVGPDVFLKMPIVRDLIRKVSDFDLNRSTASSRPSTGTPMIDSGRGSTSPNILLKFTLSPVGGNPVIYVNGKRVNPNEPEIRVPLDYPLELTAERAGYHSIHSEFVLDSTEIGGLKEWTKDLEFEPLRFGFLTIHTTPSADAIIMIDGKPWVKKTPLENEKLPVGTYNIQLKNDLLGMGKRVTISIREGKVVNVDERLEIKN